MRAWSGRREVGEPGIRGALDNGWSLHANPTTGTVTSQARATKNRASGHTRHQCNIPSLLEVFSSPKTFWTAFYGERRGIGPRGPDIAGAESEFNQGIAARN